MTSTFPPATAGGTKLVTLASSPLKRVLCVIRFAPILRISDQTGAGVGAFQEAIRADYPSVKMEFQHEIQLEADDNGVIADPRISKQAIWRFTDKTAQWRASLAQNNLMLEVDESYSGREELVGRFVRLVSEVISFYSPVEFEQLGIRFFNVFHDEQLANLERYVRPEFMALRKSMVDVELVTSVNQLHVRSDGAEILVKHGFLQAGFQTDMQQQPLDRRAWVLDIDVSRRFKGGVDAAGVKEVAKDITDTICAFFSWSVTPAFIEDYRRA